ncbi:hypothetical protein Tco_0494267 [Tanacetum coccineum]
MASTDTGNSMVDEDMSFKKISPMAEEIMVMIRKCLQKTNVVNDMVWYNDEVRKHAKKIVDGLRDIAYFFVQKVITRYNVSTSIGYGVSNFLSNTTYSFIRINTAYSLPLDTAYRSSDKLRMTKVIKGEFEKLKDLNDKDVSHTCGTSLEVFNNEFNRMSGMDDYLFTYEVEVANFPCDSNKDDDSENEADDDMGYDPSDVAFTEWLGLKNFNYKTMDHYTKKALWIYWIRGDDKVELKDEEFSDNEDYVTEVFRIDTNIFNFETPMCKTFKEFSYLLQIDPDLLTKDIEGFKTYEEFKDDWIYEWNRDVCGHTLEFGINPHHWKNNGYSNGGNLPGAYIVGNSLHYQDYEWYDALIDCELKEQALRNKAIMEGSISDGESSNDDEEYVVVKEDEYNNLAGTNDDACRAYQEIFCRMDEGWMVSQYGVFQFMDTAYRSPDLVKEISTNIGGEFINMEILKCWSLETSRRLFNTQSCSIKLHGESTEQISGEFLILILFNSCI